METATEKVTQTYDIREILNTNEQRYPFVLIDKVTNLSEDKISALKNVSFNEPFFQGHFPNNPVMPGVLLLEAMAQAASFYMMKNKRKSADTNVYLASIKDAKFFQFVQPGDTLTIEGEYSRQIATYHIMNMRGIVDDKVVVTAEMVCFIQ